MHSSATPQPARTRITHAQQVRWQEEAAAFIEHGESPAGIHAYLQEQGCPPRLRDELLRKARASVRGEHRAIGLKLFGVGALGTFLGAATIYPAMRSAMNGDDPHYYSGATFRIAIGVLFLAVPPLIYGGWKLVTGSAVDAPPQR
jgi:hypothetical protein